MATMENGSISVVKGLGTSYAEKIDNKWIIYGAKSAVLYEDGFCYKADLDINQILTLPENTPIYASEGCFLGETFEKSNQRIIGASDEYTSVKEFEELVRSTLNKIVDWFKDFDDPEFKLKSNIKNSSAAFKEIAECIFEYVSWQYMSTCVNEILDDMAESPESYSAIFEER